MVEEPGSRFIRMATHLPHPQHMPENLAPAAPDTRSPRLLELPCQLPLRHGLQRGLDLIHRALARQPGILSVPAPAVEITGNDPEALGIAIRVWCKDTVARTTRVDLRTALEGAFERNHLDISFD